jgi:biotin transport system substrate-specific component
MNKAHALDLNKELINNRAASSLIGVVFFVAAMALGSYVRIPVPGSPIPITLQTFFVLLAGAVLGKRLGLFATVSYAVISLPMLVGPTGGYFAGFAIASFVTGAMLEKKDAGIGRMIAAFAIGNLAIYALGASWLVFAYKASIVNAVSMGALPFVTGDILKIALAVMIYKSIASRSKDIFGA